MAFLGRISQSKLRHLTQKSKTIPFAALLNPSAKSCVSDNPYMIPHCGATDFGSKVRFFAAPVQQVSTKKAEKGSSGPRMNERIQADVIRVVTEEGHCIMSRSEALQRAKSLDLDLVEVQGSGSPPVCKIMDYHKEKYKKDAREKEHIKSKSDKTLRADIKEVKFSRKTEAKDLKMKADMVKRLMEKGYRVKCTATDACTSADADAEDQDFGPVFSRFIALLEDVALVECEPTKGKVKEAYLIVRHMKFGPSKKGAGKKAKTVETAGTEVQKKGSDDSNGVTSQVADIPGNTVPQRAFSRSDISESHILNAAPQRAQTVPLPPRESSDGIQNRYRINDQRNSSPPTRGMDNRGPGTGEPHLPYQSNDRRNPSPPTRGMDNRDPGMREPYIPYQSNEQRNSSPPPRGMDTRAPGMREPHIPYQSNSQRNPSPPTRGRDNRVPGMGEPHIPYRGAPADVHFSPPTRDPRQAQTNAPVFRNPVPPNDIPKQEPVSPSAPPRTGLGFGIFSNPTGNAPTRQGPSDRVPTNSNSPPSSRPDGSQGPGTGIGKVGQGGFGIFGRDSSH